MSRAILVASIFVLSASSLALAACSSSEADPRTGPQAVRVATAAPAGDSERSFTGIVSARVQSDLGFRVPGKIVARLVDAGQTVRRGQPLMRIDRTDLALAMTAQAGSVAAARARASQTAADEKRYRDLVAAGAVSASAYDQIRAAAEAAQAQLKAAEAQEHVARNEADYAVLVADADGTVVETLGEPGQVIAAGQTVVRLAHAGPREASISLPETVRPAIGSVARASLYDSAASSIARLRQLSDAADTRTRTFEARYTLEGVAANAPLGATVTLSLSQRTAGPEMRIPLAALFDNGHGPGVWIVDRKQQVVWRRIQLVGLSEESATVTGGLKPGERFVAMGAHLLHQGEQVRIAPAQGAVL